MGSLKDGLHHSARIVSSNYPPRRGARCCWSCDWSCHTGWGRGDRFHYRELAIRQIRQSVALGRSSRSRSISSICKVVVHSIIKNWFACNLLKLSRVQFKTWYHKQNTAALLSHKRCTRVKPGYHGEAYNKACQGSA